MAKAKLLIVDDEQTLIELYIRKLERLSYEVYSASSGQEALDILQQREIDVLVSDFNMPGMNGIETITRAMKIDPMLQAVVVTGYANITTAVNAIDAGAINYLEKPVNFGELDNAIDKGLERRKLLKDVQIKKKQLEEYHHNLEEMVEQRTLALTESNMKLTKEIEERKLLEKSLREAKKSADDANRAKSEFLANMSHEIRTPMTSALGLINSILDTELLPKQKEYLEMVKVSTVVMQNLLNDILDLSKIEAGKLLLESIVFSPRSIVENVISLQQLHAEEKSDTLSHSIALDVPDMVIGDPNRLRQIILNLVFNAIKFTHYGDISVTCTRLTEHGLSETSNSQHIDLHFSVKDTGIGITNEKRDVIFEAFTQGDSSTTRKYGGVGLGLNICSKLVTLLGGHIWVESEPGRGSTFHFTSKFGMQKMREDTTDQFIPRVTNAINVSGSERVLQSGEGRCNVANSLIMAGEIFNEKDALEKASGDQVVMLERLRTFVQDTPKIFKLLEEPAMSEESDLLFEKQVHCLKDRAIEVGGTNLADECFSLLMKLRKNQDVRDVQYLIKDLYIEFAEFHQEPRVKQLLQEHCDSNLK